MTQPVTVQDMITQLAEGQRHLQLVFEQQNENARKEREAFQTALKEQATLLTSNQKVQDTAILRLTDVISNARVHPNIPGSVLQKFQEGEDPDFFFTNFERVATTATWPAERWGQYIAPLLSGELQAAYQAANPAGVTPYPEIKKAILERLGCEQEYYRARFRKEKWVTGDNPRALFYRVRDLGSRWLQPSTATMEEVTEQVFLEQYLEALPVNTRAWLKQHPGLTSQSAIELACAYHRSPDFKASTGRTPIMSKMSVGKSFQRQESTPLSSTHYRCTLSACGNGPSRSVNSFRQRASIYLSASGLCNKISGGYTSDKHDYADGGSGYDIVLLPSRISFGVVDRSGNPFYGKTHEGSMFPFGSSTD
ncbi:uncharacterized protein LOC144759374 [Lissotriton helveticus]